MHFTKNSKFLALLIALLLLIPFTQISESQDIRSTWIWSSLQNKCEHGIHLQPNGPIGVILFCEHALGNYMGLVYYERMGGPVPELFFREVSEEEKATFYKTWSLENRMWQDSMWATDVTGFAWSPDGTKLYVSTSEIYGSGDLYELDVVRKRYKRIAPPGQGYIITRMDKIGKRFFYKVAPWSQEKDKLNVEHDFEIE